MNNKKAQINIGVIIMLFIGIVVVASAFIPQIFSTQNQMTSKQTITNQSVSVVTGNIDANGVNESINYSIYSQSAWKVSRCALSSVAIRSGNHTTLEADTDYTLDAANGRFSLLNTTATIPSVTLNVTYVDYSYCADGYNPDGSSRSVAALIGLFSALGLLAFVLIGVKRDWF